MNEFNFYVLRKKGSEEYLMEEYDINLDKFEYRFTKSISNIEGYRGNYSFTREEALRRKRKLEDKFECELEISKIIRKIEYIEHSPVITSIKFTFGSSIDDAFNKMIAYKEILEETEDRDIIICGEFNGCEITTDMTLDEIYLMVTKKTKKEYDEYLEAITSNYEKDKADHERNKDIIIKNYISQAKGIIQEEKLEDWSKCVHARVNDLYRGRECSNCLELIALLDIEDNSFEVCKKVFERQGHSGMSANLVLVMLERFCIKGKEFSEFVKKRG